MKKKLFILLVLLSSMFIYTSISFASYDYRTKIGKFDYDYAYSTPKVNYNSNYLNWLITYGAKDNYLNPEYTSKYFKSNYDGYLYNDIQSLVIVIEYMESVAKIYFPAEDSNNLVLGYVRGINKNYDDLEWNCIAGKINEKYIAKINELDKKELNQ